MALLLFLNELAAGIIDVAVGGVVVLFILLLISAIASFGARNAENPDKQEA
jgi:hypothetical protein